MNAFSLTHPNLCLGQFEKNIDNSITYLAWTDALNGNASIANMRNSAGSLVTVSSASIQSAMDDIRGIIKTGRV